MLSSARELISALDLGLEGLAQGDGAADVGLDHFAALPHRGGGDGTGGLDVAARLWARAEAREPDPQLPSHTRVLVAGTFTRGVMCRVLVSRKMTP